MYSLHIEFFGTLLHVLSVILLDNPLLVGLFLALLVYLLKGLFNPAVAIMLAGSGKIKINNAFKIIGIQLIAGLAAYQLSKYIK